MSEDLATGWGAHEAIDDSLLRRFVFNQADVVRALAFGPTARHAADDSRPGFVKDGLPTRAALHPTPSYTMMCIMVCIMVS